MWLENGFQPTVVQISIKAKNILSPFILEFTNHKYRMMAPSPYFWVIFGGIG